MDGAKKKDFFVSYNRHDQAIAEWIACVLEAAGYTTVIQAWDFRPGGNFVLDMHNASANTERTIAVLSPNYLRSEYTQPEWAAAFVQDPTGKKRTLIPVRVEACEVSGLLAVIVYIDLVGKTEAQKREALLQGVSEQPVARDRVTQFPRLETPQNLPRISDVFVGRTEALETLHQQLQPGERMSISSVVGMGGIGKTELALQYAHQHLKAKNYPGGVCWLNARGDLGIQIVSFARTRLQLAIPEDIELPEQIRLCWREWQKDETLIVFDDVQAYTDIQPFLPPQKAQFRVLLTTRRNLGSFVRSYEIAVLTEDASLELLRLLVRDGRIDQDLDGAKQLCEWLGYLPLGLELVGRYLARKKGLSIAKLWKRLQEKRLAAKALLEAAPEMTASLGVAAAFELSWQELNQEAQRLAALLSLFALAEIPWSMVRSCLPESDEEELEDLRDDQLVNLSLLSFEREEVYQLHQLLREFFAAKRSLMPEDEEMKRSFCGVMVTIGQQIPYTMTLDTIKQFTPAIPHLKEVATTLNPWLLDEVLITPSVRIARFYEGQLEFREAEEWCEYCRVIAAQRFGDDHPNVATSLNNLAELYRLQGRYEDAEPLHKRALQIRQRQLEPDHLDVAQSLNNLALLHQLQGRYKDVEPLYRQALEIKQRQLGEDHSDVAVSLNNLAALHRLQGQYEDAEPLYKRALEIRQRQLGDDHPDVAQSLNNLAALYYAQGQYENAKPLYEQSLRIRERQFGTNHPAVAQSLNNLANLYRFQEVYADAEQAFLKTLAICIEKLGETHPNTQTVWENFRLLLHQVIQEHRTSELSDHPMTRSLLQQLQNEES
ncbi:MAG: tetratricopeptide repeat protein [Phormidium tanganyikae FI6-MK23]|jgi:tetratricopeptide (TPR) repeat protein|nr:tetratricopeptide repeat protein [Phormidium tanganyikae FI6-MK23]